VTLTFDPLTSKLIGTANHDKSKYQISRLWVKGILSYWAETLFERPGEMTFDKVTPKIKSGHLLIMTNLNTLK
jgi:hypothetical protein